MDTLSEAPMGPASHLYSLQASIGHGREARRVPTPVVSSCIIQATVAEQAATSKAIGREAASTIETLLDTR